MALLSLPDTPRAFTDLHFRVEGGKELVDGGGHPDGEVDPLLVLLLEFVVPSVDCAQIGFPLMKEGRTLAIWIKDRGNELGSCWVSSPFRMCTYRYAMLSRASSTQVACF